MTLAYAFAAACLTAAALCFAAVFYLARRQTRRRLAAEFEAAKAQRAREAADRAAKIAAFAALVESVAIVTTEYEAPLSQDEADELQRLCAFRLRAEIVTVRA